MSPSERDWDSRVFKPWRKKQAAPKPSNIAQSLEYVFAQLKLIGVKAQEPAERRPDHAQRIRTPSEYFHPERRKVTR